MARRLLGWYSNAMAKHPLLTNVSTAVPLMLCGDTIAQRIEGRHRLDTGRTLTMACYSGAVFTPFFFTVYRWMDGLTFRGGRLQVAAAKALLVICVGGIPINVTFLTLATTVEMKILGKQARDGAGVPTVVLGKLKSELPRIMIGSLCFWGPVNIINFMYLKTYRLVLTSTAACVWNVFLSLVQHEYVRVAETDASG